jgi:hypothetical protein
LQRTTHWLEESLEAELPEEAALELEFVGDAVLDAELPEEAVLELADEAALELSDKDVD